MGYSTDFSGEFRITPGLPEELISELNEFCRTRHEGRSAPAVVDVDDLNRPYGGALEDTTGIGIWCNWEFDGAPGEDVTVMRWNDSEKAYNMEEWAAFIWEHHIPKGHEITGEVYAQGEESDDCWRMVAHNGVIYVQQPIVTWPDLEPVRECSSAESPDGRHAYNDRGVCVLCGTYTAEFDTEPENADRLPTYVAGVGSINA